MAQIASSSGPVKNAALTGALSAHCVVYIDLQVPNVTVCDFTVVSTSVVDNKSRTAYKQEMAMSRLLLWHDVQPLN